MFDDNFVRKLRRFKSIEFLQTKKRQQSFLENSNTTVENSNSGSSIHKWIDR